jgi:hypothetical protein
VTGARPVAAPPVTLPAPTGPVSQARNSKKTKTAQAVPDAGFAFN